MAAVTRHEVCGTVLVAGSTWCHRCRTPLEGETRRTFVAEDDTVLSSHESGRGAHDLGSASAEVARRGIGADPDGVLRCEDTTCGALIPAGANRCIYCGAVAPEPGSVMALVKLQFDWGTWPIGEEESLGIGRLPSFSPLANRLAEVLEVGRRHATVRLHRGVLTLTDHDSTNGTWVNGRRARPEQEITLRDGDEIQISQQMSMRVVWESSR
jgi:hypothetical protein